ncbi:MULTISPECIES: hypothetical protein [unclassified Pseudofrankia]|uniref:hypothetical protein n=1 Tax=unclassified Pseudofrankia TaxID=2994372 RepID=UPI0012FFCC30|nr:MULTISPECIES: hypothetical protein [unclassified Pseudofrankia]MDT3446073.1 hypothetical protein [Pseudofrankia sp. BMG5.37]
MLAGPVPGVIDALGGSSSTHEQSLDLTDEHSRKLGVQASVNASLSQLPEASQRRYLE